MSRIVSAVNVMILNSKKIDPILVQNDEYFFVYDNKHKWSVIESNDDIVLRLYAKNDQTLEQIVSAQIFGAIPNTVSYSARELGGREVWQSWKELLTLVKEKALGVRDVLDEIISSADDDIPF